MLSLVAMVLRLALALMRWVERRQLQADADARAQDDYLRAAEEIARVARSARARVADDAASVRDDPDNRDARR